MVCGPGIALAGTDCFLALPMLDGGLAVRGGSSWTAGRGDARISFVGRGSAGLRREAVTTFLRRVGGEGGGGG